MKVQLSVEEAKQLSVMERYVSKDVGLLEGAERLGIDRSTFLKKVARYRALGAEGLAHGLRGKPGNRKRDEALREAVCELFRTEYQPHGFRVAHFYEDAAKRFPKPVSYPTVVRWFRASGLTQAAHKGRRHHTRRPRRAAFGELLQMDASIHDWLGWERNLALVSVMDDATNHLCGAHLNVTDTTLDNMRALHQAFRRYGLPQAIYVDRSPIYKVIRRGGTGKIRRPTFEAPYVTQFQRALEELGVEIIYALSPQAKGRIERSFAVWQGRLVPELRKHGIRELERANAYIQDVFMPHFNERFAAPPAKYPSVFIQPEAIDYNAYLAEKHSMRVTNDHILLSKAKGVSLRILPSKKRISFAKARVDVLKHLDGNISVLYRGEPIPFERYTAPRAA